MARFVFALLFAVFGLGPASAGAPQRIEPLNFLPAIAGDYFALPSKATGTTYHVYVRYPEGYGENPARRYPTVYLLDGDSLYPLLATQHLLLTIDDKLPEAIIVGIAYGSFKPDVNRRERDFGAGADAFQRFLATELIPRVESTSRADPARRILVGQSFGGSFVLYSALSKPDLFWARIASNPSFRLHGEKFWAAGAPATRRDLRLLVVSGTANAPEPREEAIKWVGRWTSRKAPWTVERIDLQGGTHAADIANAYRAAFRRLFPGPAPPAN